MMLGVEFDVPVNPVINNALLEQHMVLINAGTNILRVIPPLVVTEKDVDEAIDRLKKALAALN